uniref:Kinesin-like protein n=1 Tax=Gallus gallus TaxID=9031 RepID=A1KXL9_CHICK|nr:XCTK2-like motor protein [Gallus gallus]|eukprot:NP_001075167.1 kinesin-like protein KIFC1 [Gallus gallus]
MAAVGSGGSVGAAPGMAVVAPLPAPTSRLPVRRAAAKRAASGPQPAAPEQKWARSGAASSQPPGRAPLRALSVPAAPGPGPPRKALTVTAAPRTGKGNCGAAPVPAAAPVGGAHRRRAAWDLKGQLSDLRAALGNQKEKAQRLDGENRQLREQLRELQEALRERERRVEELDGRVSTLSTELEKHRQESELRGQQLEELREADRELSARLEAAEAQLHQTKAVLAQSDSEVAELRLRAESQARRLREQEELHKAEVAELRAQNQTQSQRLQEKEEQQHALEMERRRLHNLVQELKGNIRVFCRVRPLLAAEKEKQKGMEHLHFPPQDNKTLVLLREEESHIGRERKEDLKYDFSFDRVFRPSASQEEVFEDISLLVQSALDGYHVCIFAYGQTGSGKTYTMEGPDALDPERRGMIPRAVRQVFQGAQELAEKGWQYRFSASFLEIYNESLRDLLGARPECGELEIRRVSSASEELHVPNLRRVPVASEDEVLRLLQTATANRSVARTALNDHSSRSHSIFQLRIDGTNAARELRCSSVLSLVDLAGSERLDKSQSQGQRLRETQSINTSLSSLGLVIMALAKKEPHIPYRNSKLTYLLQNSLGGNAKMLMFVNISPLEENFSESLNSLRFASKVNECVVGTAHANRK